MSYQIKKILERVRRYWFDKDFSEDDWKNPHGDVVALGILVDRLVKQVHVLNQNQSKPENLCPLCAGSAWGRPMAVGATGVDMSRRMCHECGEIRAEWKVVEQ